MSNISYLELNLCLGNILFATTTAGNLLSLSNLTADGFGTEVLNSVGLRGVDAEGGVGLDSGESSGNLSRVLASSHFWVFYYIASTN